jgi:glutaredoxin
MTKEKKLIIIILFLLIGFFAFYSKQKKQDLNQMEEFIQCLARESVVIYGSQYCPACSALIDQFEGYDIKLIYVECSREQEKCAKEMQTDYVPEIQINKQNYSGLKNIEKIGQAVNCQLF